MNVLLLMSRGVAEAALKDSDAAIRFPAGFLRLISVEDLSFTVYSNAKCGPPRVCV